MSYAGARPSVRIGESAGRGSNRLCEKTFNHVIRSPWRERRMTSHAPCYEIIARTRRARVEDTRGPNDLMSGSNSL